MPERLQKIIDLMPFFLTSGVSPQMNIPRVLELAFMAGVLWMMVQNIQTDVAELKKTVTSQNKTLVETVHSLELQQERMKVMLNLHDKSDKQ